MTQESTSQISVESSRTDHGSSLRALVRRGLAWSVLGNLLLRSTNVVMGIIVARILAPDQFGVFAVGLTVMSILMAITDLGLTVDLVRSDNFDERAPTVATVSTVSGAVFTAALCLAAGPLADAMKVPQADSVIRLLAFVLFISGVAVVPYSRLLRDFRQKEIFQSYLLAFVISTIGLFLFVKLGMGALALGVSRLLAHASSSGMWFFQTRTGLRFGFNRDIAVSALKFSLPVAGVSLLTVIMLSVDNIVIAAVCGEVSLGFYVLAFNIAGWPSTVIGNAISAISLAAFSRADGARLKDSVHNSVVLTWTAALAIGVALAMLARPLLEVVYGSRWLAADVALGVLGVFGATVVVCDLFTNLLFARNKSRPVLYVNLASLVLLVPALVIGADRQGIVGAATGRLAVGALFTFPVLLMALRVLHVGASAVGAVWPPLAAAVPSALLTHFVIERLASPYAQLACGSLAFGIVYAGLLFRWLRPSLALMREAGTNAAPSKPPANGSTTEETAL